MNPLSLAPLIMLFEIATITVAFSKSNICEAPLANFKSDLSSAGDRGTSSPFPHLDALIQLTMKTAEQSADTLRLSQHLAAQGFSNLRSLSLSSDSQTLLHAFLKLEEQLFGNEQFEDWQEYLQSGFQTELSKRQSGELAKNEVLKHSRIPFSKNFQEALNTGAESGELVSLQISTYGLTPDELFEVACVAATQNGWRTSELIQNYGIKNQDQLFQIALKAAVQSGAGISKFIQNYGIENQDQLFQIALTAAAQNGWRTSELIQNYGIENQDQLFQIALTAAAQNGSGTSQYIHTFGIKNQNQLLQIALTAAAQSGAGTSQSIHNYGIKNQDQLLQIALKAVAQNGLTIRLIHHYKIRNRDSLVQIAFAAAAQAGSAIRTELKYFPIPDEKMRYINRIMVKRDRALISAKP